MFFIFGISTKEEKIDFSQNIVCEICGSYGRLEAFMTYTYFSLFFIKIFKWNKKYYIGSTCCNTLYTIDKALGRDIELGFESKINESELLLVDKSTSRVIYCKNCNYPIETGFEYCPKCGVKL